MGAAAEGGHRPAPYPGFARAGAPRTSNRVDSVPPETPLSYGLGLGAMHKSSCRRCPEVIDAGDRDFLALVGDNPGCESEYPRIMSSYPAPGSPGEYSSHPWDCCQHALASQS